VEGGGPALVLSEDEKYAYLVGLRLYEKSGEYPAVHTVFRAALQGDGTLEPFFGDPLVSGGDQDHLNEPACLAIDAEDHLYVADRGNDRIVIVNCRTGACLGAFPVESPEWVGVHRASGAAYVYSHRQREKAASLQEEHVLIRFSPWPRPKAEYKIKLPPIERPSGPGRRKRYMPGLDSRSRRARIWLGRLYNTEALKRPEPRLVGFCDDLGDGFSGIKPVVGRPGGVLTRSITSDPSHRYITINRGGTLVIDDRTGRVIRPKCPQGTFMMGPDGFLYVMSNSGNIRRYTLEGKPVPFEGVRPGAWVLEHDSEGSPVYVRKLYRGERLMGGVS